MKKNSFEILIPKQDKRNDTLAYETLEERIRDLFVSISAKKKIQIIWMEMYQNMMKFRTLDHLSLFRLKTDDLGQVTLISINYSRKVNVEILEKKFFVLQNSKNLRKDFRMKLMQKAESEEKKQGDFGLDFCFRYSKSRKFKRISLPNHEEIVYLAFSFPLYE